MARKADDKFEVFGICREHECHFVWLREPEDPPNCPSCGDTRWPMSPAEAEAVRKSNISRYGEGFPRRRKADQIVRTEGDKCPTCEGGTLFGISKVGHGLVTLCCDNCSASFDVGPGKVTMVPGDLMMAMDDGTFKRIDDAADAHRVMGQAAQDASRSVQQWQVVSGVPGQPDSLQQLAQDRHEYLEQLGREAIKKEEEQKDSDQLMYENEEGRSTDAN